MSLSEKKCCLIEELVHILKDCIDRADELRRGIELALRRACTGFVVALFSHQLSVFLVELAEIELDRNPARV
ncbi:MAG: hypothetical protein QXJ97_11730 [Desulfurococcaceae archaeon]